MRSLVFTYLAMAVGQALAMPVDDGFNAIVEKRLHEKRQDLDKLVMGVLNRSESFLYLLRLRELIFQEGNGGKVADPPGFMPKRVVLKSRTNIPGAQTIKLRYGPYKVPNMGITNILGESEFFSLLETRDIKSMLILA
jgi:hypothetical protein